MNHEFYMARALELAKNGEGFVSPNPLVGAVLVKNNKIIGEGFHAKYGSHHAEVMAFLDAQARQEDVTGAILYCNLEPCSHTNKKTPPCTPRVIKEKIKTVVIANIDPNPFVNGAGINQMRQAGVEVITGVLEKEGAQLNEVFFKFIQRGTPFIHLKMAQSLDGKIATITGESKYITGNESLKKVHELRQKYDCIMVGRNTLELDNPSLTVRHPDIENKSHPLRLIVTSLGKLNKNWAVLNDEFKRNTMIITTDSEIEAHSEIVHFLETQGVALLQTKANSTGQIDFHSLLKTLASLKLTSILVEGGPTLASSLIKEKLVDKLSLFIAPVILGNGKESFLDVGVKSLDQKIIMENRTVTSFGNDILFEGSLCSQD
jgi:diaminohydroxyphosphoribosylaminopyrimidine deaminase/5-amino-6-(5-phosphoribosylamino)uracil reductase